MHRDARWGDDRERDGGGPERDVGGRGGGNGGARPRDEFRRDLDLPDSGERVRVQHRDRSYSLNDEDVRALSTIGAFRVVGRRTSPDLLQTRLARARTGASTACAMPVWWRRSPSTVATSVPSPSGTRDATSSRRRVSNAVTSRGRSSLACVARASSRTTCRCIRLRRVRLRRDNPRGERRGRRQPG